MRGFSSLFCDNGPEKPCITRELIAGMFYTLIMCASLAKTKILTKEPNTEGVGSLQLECDKKHCHYDD